jgi:CRP/FNR family transcriptional regulator, cyclic AMP receptor protein
MSTGFIGNVYQDGEVIVYQGELGECMYVIQSGKAEVLEHKCGTEIRLAVLGEGDFFGEMALIDRETRSATVRAKGEVRAITVDRKTFRQRILEDPWLAFRILEKMSRRIRDLDYELARCKTEGCA